MRSTIRSRLILRHAAKVTLAVLAFLFGLFFVGFIAALVMEDEE